MSYTYQKDDMDALRVTFEEMMSEITDLRGELSEADDAIIELYNEANDLERELFLLREQYEQDMFDSAEDYIDLERSYNLLADKYMDLHDFVMDDEFPEFIPFSR